MACRRGTHSGVAWLPIAGYSRRPGYSWPYHRDVSRPLRANPYRWPRNRPPWLRARGARAARARGRGGGVGARQRGDSSPSLAPRRRTTARPPGISVPIRFDLLLAHGFTYDSSMMANDYTPYRARAWRCDCPRPSGALRRANALYRVARQLVARRLSPLRVSLDGDAPCKVACAAPTMCSPTGSTTSAIWRARWSGRAHRRLYPAGDRARPSHAHAGTVYHQLQALVGIFSRMDAVAREVDQRSPLP